MTEPTGIEQNFELAALTTVRTGGPADFYARPSDPEAVVQLLGWAQVRALPVGVVGSGSNLLVADSGFRGLVIKLDGQLTAFQFDASGVTVGGGMRLPSLAAKLAAQGLAGLEFGVSIPGTVGGAIRMNANAYGGELARVLDWAEVATADGVERRTPEQLDFHYRQSNITAGQIVTRARFALTATDPAVVKAELADLRDRRKEAQPAGIKTFGSTFKNPDDPRANGLTAGKLLEAAGCKGLESGGARFSPKHANFVENFRAATTDDIVALIAEGRRRVAAEFEGLRLETEVQVLGEVDTALWGVA